MPDGPPPTTSRTTPRPQARVVQAGVIPYRRTPDGVEILLVSTRSRAGWVTPKGGVPRHTCSRNAAAREAFEEAGAVGQLSETVIAAYTYARRDTRYRVDLYGLEVAAVAARWPEMDERKRLWRPASEAAEMVVHPGLARCLRAFDPGADADLAS